jgi:hypothetical protein
MILLRNALDFKESFNYLVRDLSLFWEKIDKNVPRRGKTVDNFIVPKHQADEIMSQLNE